MSFANGTSVSVEKTRGEIDRLQLLCANCNFGKLMNGGTCPHKAVQNA